MVYTIELWSEKLGDWMEWDVASSKAEALSLANSYNCNWRITDEYGNVVA